MKQLEFTYRTVYTFSEAIHDHSYTLKIYPRESKRQQVLSLVETVSYGDSHSYSYDTFGNKTVYGSISMPHNSFSFEISGLICVDDNQKERDTDFLSLFCVPSAMTRVTNPLRELLESLVERAEEESCFHKKFDEMPAMEQAAYLSDCCHKLLTYTPDITDVQTDATKALLLGKGVCQDYAHILIALLRMVHLPARYVVGFMAGEGFTHAWVEVFIDGCWQGLDPTNSRLIDETYIKLSHGRDYNDTMVCKGYFYGNVTQTQDIQVIVTEVPEHMK